MSATDAASGTDLAFAGVARQVELVRSGEVTSRALVELYLDRILRLDQRLNAFRVVFAEQALAAADQADARCRAGDQRPLLGVPLAIKDDQDVAGEVTAYGSLAHGGPAAADSEIVRRLRSAGAVIVGKTNVPELMTMPWTESSAYGATHNPWDLDRTPGGSSGGSGAAVAAGLVAAATASDGAGSIRIPAGACGLVGLKPQRGRVPGLANDWHGLSVLGFLTRTVADTALLYDVVKDGGPSFAEAAGREPGRLRIAMSARVPQPVLARADGEQRGGLEAMAARLRALGHEVVERDPDYGTVFTRAVARYLRGIHDDAMALPRSDRLTRVTRGLARMGAAVPPSLVAKAIEAEDSDRERINRIFEAADVLMTPVFTRRPTRVLEYEGRGGQWSVNAAARIVPYAGVFNHLGQPAISLPAGSTPDGFPLAVQFAAPPDGEPVLLALASQLERELGWPEHRPPLS